jgi:hypothetical protein
MDKPVWDLNPWRELPMPRETPVSREFYLARQDGIESRSVLLSVTPAGVRVGANDQGPAALQIGAHDGEYEFWVDVPNKGIPTLVFALLKEKYSGNLEAVDQFRAFCADNDIPHKFWTWT